MSGAEGTFPSSAPVVGGAGGPKAVTGAPRRRLFRKYVLLLIALVAAALLVTSGFDFWFSYQENKAALVGIQQEKAQSAARRIEEFVGAIERQIGWTTHVQWASAPLDQRLQDFSRLLRQVPAITELSELDGEGREQLKVSRLEMNAIGSGRDFSRSPAFIEAKAHRIWFSPVYFRKQSEPYMTLAMARDGRNSGVTVAEINLKLIWDVITALKIGQGGYAYVVDGNGRLVAHPDISLVLRDTDLATLPQVAAALRPEPGAPPVTVATNLAGRSVLTSHAAIAQLGWLVFVEVPLREAFAPLYGAAIRTALLLVLGLAAAALVALALARRMTGPIRAIAEGAARLGAGELGQRLDIHTGDEIEVLAGQFNRMAGDLQKSYAELEQRVRDRTAELSEALEQQTATAEVLGVINSSPGDLAPVFDSILEKAHTLCGAEHGALQIYDGEFFRPAAMRGLPEAFAELLRQGFLARGNPLAEALLAGEAFVHSADLVATHPVLRAPIELAGVRTLLCVPLRKDKALLGAIFAFRREVRPFTDKQIALLQNFAAQAVIAMENARLITETREALEQQTATAEVLGVINSSPGNLAPVFDAMLDKAMALCEAVYGQIATYDGRFFQFVAVKGEPRLVERHPRDPLPPAAGITWPKIAEGQPFVHILDLLDSDLYRSGHDAARSMVELGGCRTMLTVALRRDQALMGGLTVYRQEVRPFSDKEIALLQNFAAQAVIAMENARLITETREALEQQTATAEVLGVINSSPGDLVPVFTAILEKAHSLCGVAHGGLVLRDGEIFRAVATQSYSGTFAEQLRQGFRGEDSPIMQPLLDGEDFVHIPDLAQIDDPMVQASVKQGVRTGLYVPLRKDDALLGMISSCRTEVRPFSDKEIALLQNFAAQAVIAMENARLITETREALEQQTATAEVLGVINSSPGDLAPVFDAILEKAHVLCGAPQGGMFLRDGDQFRAVATRGMPEVFAERLRQGIGPDAPVPRPLVAGEDFVHIQDMAEVDHPTARMAVEVGAARSLLAVPLRKGDTLFGMIAAGRRELQPYSDKQIALLQNFAAQAVIAIENARLITETREALEQQTATAEVLGVINASPGDLAPVFDAMLEKAMRLCGALFGGLQTYDGDTFVNVAVRGGGLPVGTAVRPQPGFILGRLVGGQDIVHVTNVFDDPAYHVSSAFARMVEAGVRSVLTVALRKGSTLLGAISIYGSDPQPFTDKQIALLENFAAQAVIAIENARLITETREALEQQTATAEVLGVINSSPGDLAPVFDAMLEKATRLCDAAFGVLWRTEGDQVRCVASHGVPEAYRSFLQRETLSPGPESGVARTIRERSALHFADAAAGEPFRRRDPFAVAAVELGGVRTLVNAPLIKDDAVLGIFGIYRTEVRPFTDKQIALLQNFAAQAVIAMENARLITETREALEQQTATAEVLGVINSSPGDLAPVFDAMLERAMHLCGAAFGLLQTYDGQNFRTAATRGVPPAYAEFRKNNPPAYSHPGTGPARLLTGERVVHIADLKDEDAYRSGEPNRHALVDLGGARTSLLVGLAKDGQVLGFIQIYRQEVRPFSDKQIALLQNFSAQAVIAIENARLITETREALEQQTATAEVLQVINSSPGDLAPVFDAMLEKMMRLCEAAHGHFLVYDGAHFHPGAFRGEASFDAVWRQGFPFQPAHDGNPLARLISGERLVHDADARGDAAYREAPQYRRIIDAGGIRTSLAVALRKESKLLGAVRVYRQEVRPFTDKQIALVENFAAQAVIAMENARLITETRERTRDLQESLEYQTATSDVLKVISQSTFDLEPVLQTVLETAARLCRADMAHIRRREGEVYRIVGSFALEPAFDKFLRERHPTSGPGRGSVVERCVLERRIVHVADAATDPEYTVPEVVQLGRIRTSLGVPLLREGEPIGLIALGRQHVEPFTEKEIELVSTFADQAVIAIENARLLNELRESTDELARSVEELQALSEVGQAVSSTLELRAVLSTILNRSVALADADAGAIFRYRQSDRTFRFVEAVGYTEAMARDVRALDIDENATGLGIAIANRAPLQIPDLRERPPNPLRDQAAAAGYRSALIVPLVGADRVLGATVLQRRVVGEFPDATVRLMQTLASQSALAIQNARLFNEIAEKSEQLAEASRHKSQFLANMSHELRTPLNAILGYTELMADGIYGELAPRAAGVLERVQNNGKHLLALINDVLDLSKIEAGQLVLTLEDYAMADVIHSVVSATESLANNKGLKFTADIAPGLPTGHGDARRLAQVLLNLVGNAVKFTDAGEVAIAAAAEDSRFVLTVRDTGPGIAPEDQAKIFEEFQQIDNSNTRKKGGTGLGLAISKRMVEMQGGTIAVESELGQGALFRVMLPIRVEELPDELMGAA